jgi:hypothetical protein
MWLYISELNGNHGKKNKWPIINPPRNFIPNSAWKRPVFNSTNTTTSARQRNQANKNALERQ